jgi:thioredoxin-related protein
MLILIADCCHFLFLPKKQEVKKCIFILCLMLHVAGFSQEWNYDLETARKKAVAENKNILLVFTGSDWCTRCMQLDKALWQTEEFKSASQNWVLLRADFQRKRGIPDPVDINDPKIILTEKYNRDGFFPFFVLLDKNGKVISKSGYEDLATAEDYISMFKRMGR